MCEGKDFGRILLRPALIQITHFPFQKKKLIFQLEETRNTSEKTETLLYLKMLVFAFNIPQNKPHFFYESAPLKILHFH